MARSKTSRALSLAALGGAKLLPKPIVTAAKRQAKGLKPTPVRTRQGRLTT